MKKVLLTVATALLLMPAALRADEGMWLLPLLEKMNSDALRNLGSRLTPEHIAAIKAHGYCPEHRKSFHPKELEPTLFDQI